MISGLQFTEVCMQITGLNKTYIQNIHITDFGFSVLKESSFKIS